MIIDRILRSCKLQKDSDLGQGTVRLYDKRLVKLPRKIQGLELPRWQEK